MSSQPPFDHQFNPPPPKDFDKPPAEAKLLDPPQTSRKALWSMILGISSFFLCLLTGLPAIILGFIGLGEINRSQGRLAGSGMATSGIVMGFLSFLTGCGMVLPILLLLPAINAAREAARRNGCIANVRIIAISAANHEAVTRRLPLANDSQYDLQSVVPGQASGGAGDDGYSFLVKLLPFLEVASLYDDIKTSSQNFTVPAFDRSVSGGLSAAWRTQLPAYRCPSFAGDITCRESAGYPDADTASGNYVAIVATDFSPGSSQPGGPAAWKGNSATWENGALVSAMAGGDAEKYRGVALRDMPDGLSNTFLCTESCEQAFGCWYSGGSTWVVAVTPQSARGAPSDGITADASGHITANGEVLSLNFGDLQALPGSEDVYLSSGPHWAGATPRIFGPSSNHSGSVVIHAFVDARAQAISSDVDPTVYLRLVSRNGGEVVRSPDL